VNLCKAYVVEVLDAPKFYRFESAEWWQVIVLYECEGIMSTKPLIFDTREEAEEVDVGYEFLT
jgi:hypothetical protein